MKFSKFLCRLKQNSCTVHPIRIANAVFSFCSHLLSSSPHTDTEPTHSAVILTLFKLVLIKNVSCPSQHPEHPNPLIDTEYLTHIFIVSMAFKWQWWARKHNASWRFPRQRHVFATARLSRVRKLMRLFVFQSINTNNNSPPQTYGRYPPRGRCINDITECINVSFPFFKRGQRLFSVTTECGERSL